MSSDEENNRPQFPESDVNKTPDKVSGQIHDLENFENSQNKYPEVLVINPSTENRIPYTRYLRFILIPLIFLVFGSTVIYVLSSQEEVKNENAIEEERSFNFQVSITPNSNNEPDLIVSPNPTQPLSTSSPTKTPSPTSTEKVINFVSKGETDLEKSVTANLIKAWEEDKLVKIDVRLKNNSSESQKLFYFLFEIESKNGWDEAKQRFITKKGQPYDGEIILNPQQEKTETISFEKVPYPYFWNYWISNAEIRLGYAQ